MRPDTSINQKTKQTKMKKLFSLLFVAGALSIVSCGPSAEEAEKIAAETKAKMDSLFNAAQMTAPEATTDTTAATTDTTAAAH